MQVYRNNNNVWSIVDITSDEKRNDDIWPVPQWANTIDSKYVINDNGQPRPMTEEEKKAYDIEHIVIPIVIEKSLELKTAENNYLLICEQLTGNKNKLGSAELDSILMQLMTTNQNTAILLTLKLLEVDALGKREGGLKWWDNIEWHQDIV